MKGIRQYGDDAHDELIKECRQLNELSIFEPVHKQNLSRESQTQGLNSIDLITMERFRKIKARTVVDGKKYRTIYKKTSLLICPISRRLLYILGHRRL